MATLSGEPIKPQMIGGWRPMAVVTELDTQDCSPIFLKTGKFYPEELFDPPYQIGNAR
jgi:hypothetical protein